MERAQQRDAVNTQKFFFRRFLAPIDVDDEETVEVIGANVSPPQSPVREKEAKSSIPRSGSRTSLYPPCMDRKAMVKPFHFV